MTKLLQQPLVRYALVLLTGVAIGAIFYPSKSIREEEVRKYEQKIQEAEHETYLTKVDAERTINQMSQQHKQEKEELSQKTEKLKEENFRLKSKVTEKKFKLIKPDGTVEERWFKESETDVVNSVITSIRSEFDRKVTSIEGKWKKIHERRVTKIKEEHEKEIKRLSETKAEVKKTKKVDINKRSFGMSLGMTNEEDFFSSVTYDIFGPVFLDLHLESDQQFGDKEVGIGIGLRF